MTYPVIRLQIVDLFPKHQKPEVLAEKLDHVEVIIESRSVAREPVIARDRASGLEELKSVSHIDDQSNVVRMALTACSSRSSGSQARDRAQYGEKLDLPLYKPLSDPVAQPF